MAGLKRADVLRACKNLGVEKVFAPQWATGKDKHVYVRVLPATEDVYETVQKLAADLKAKKITGPQNMAGWCVLGVTDAQGVPMFKAGDQSTLAKGPLTPLTDCFVKLLKLNGITGAKDPEKN